MGLTHFDQAPSREYSLGHLRARWTALGEAGGSVEVGLRRIQIEPGAWSTPAHDHGRSEELFYVLAGEGISWQRGNVAPVGPGDCILYAPRAGEHTLRAGPGGLDVLAFGQREHDEALRFPQLGISVLGGRAVASEGGPPDGTPVQFVREAEHGPPPLPGSGAPPGPRPSTIVNLSDVAPQEISRPRVKRARRDLGRAVGSRRTGLNHVTVAPGMLSAPLHCHSLEEEIFVILAGEGALALDDDETPVRAGHVICRPAGTGVSHAFRAGGGGLVLLAYGTRDPGDICFYPRSGKISFRGVGVIARLERLDYWDGED
ncbi:MAG TPA: cupin domain-containing protein [Solirubrobacteraceae bacterium]|nr:cupin domain-containing protein [Solirubrobacteraceae bacterium]